ncbi:AlbA family DNA-binding domain-containing protein [Spirosoma aerophilum]
MEVSYAYSNFGKPLAEITLNDLNHFFATEQEESDTLEFKSYAERGQNNHTHKEAGVLKTICAFLNSSGGLVIWGAPEGHTPQGRQTKVFTGDLSPVTKLIEKDTFIAKVANAIVPLSNLVKMHRVEVVPNEYVYLFDVSQSISKPHQFDNRYWVRSDGQSNVAPHYLIDALFKQIRYPNLGGYIKFGSCFLAYTNVLDLHLRIILFNHSKEQNEYDLYFSIAADKGKFVGNRGEGLGIFELDDTRFRKDEVAKIVSYSHSPFHDIILRINYDEIVNEREEGISFEVMLTFGGRLSPMKRSNYKLTFRRFGGFSRGQEEEIENMFQINKEVNTMMNELGMSEEERVRLFLNQ